MKLALKHVVAVIVVALSFASSALAGPFEDGIAAARNHDWEAASKLWGPIENQGDANTQFHIGDILDKGEIVPNNGLLAMKWYDLAANNGHAEAQFRLAENYYGRAFGMGSPPSDDYFLAAKWYKKAAEQGNTKAQSKLGYIFSAGEGVSKDYAEAAKWYRKAADQGNGDAQFGLGYLYEQGKGVPQDYAEAVKLYQTAADQGEAFAQDSLGQMYETGRGVSQDYLKAYFWFNLAAAQENYPEGPLTNFSRHRDLAAKHLTPAQLAEAQKLAREWKRTTQSTR